MTIKIKYLLMAGLTLMAGSSCKKDFLEKKPSLNLVVPATMTDLQGLLDNPNVGLNQLPGLDVMSTDEFYVDPDYFQYSPPLANSYLWKPDIFEGQATPEWENPYKAIFYTNVVLDALPKLDSSRDAASYRQVKGSALFFRAHQYFGLVQHFAAPYQEASAGSIAGVPLHLTSDVNQMAGRGTLQQTYDQILSDLLVATSLLPPLTSHRTRPSRPAALALLARVYLTIGNYQKADQYAKLALEGNDHLIDFNTLNPAVRNPLPSGLLGLNPEVLFYSDIQGYGFIEEGIAPVSEAQDSLYGPGDLRKGIYYNESLIYKGNYTGSSSLFGGIATDEVYLIRAECLARTHQTIEAMQLLNSLLRNRYAIDTYVERVAANEDDALNQVLLERRRELFARGFRWQDLRRLNLESRFAVTLSRTVEGKQYQLPPNDPRYAFPIPDNEINRSGIAQNPRL